MAGNPNQGQSQGQVRPDPYPESAPRPLSIDCDLFSRIVEAGIFGDKPRVFLWEGQIVEWAGRTPKGRRHAYALNVLGAFLRNVTPAGWFVEQGQLMEIGKDSLKPADLKIVRGEIDDYRERIPCVHDVPLVVEISDAEIEFDRGELLRAYAAAAVPLYWVANVKDCVIEVYTKPTGPVESPRFESCRFFGPDDEVPVILDGREVGKVAVKDVLF